MKQTIALSLIALSATLTSFAASPQPVFEARATYHFDDGKTHDLQVIDVFDLTDQELSQAVEGNFSNLVVKFPKGAALPIHFYLKGDLLSLIDGKEGIGKVQVMQTFYARFAQGELILSSDLFKWKPFLEFITGKIDACLSVRDGEPSIGFGSETNRRP